MRVLSSCVFLTVTLGLIASGPASGQSDHVDGTLRAVLQTADSSQIETRVETSARRLETLAATSPDVWLRAHVVMAQRTDSARVVGWGSGDDIEILRLESQTLTGRGDEVITAWMGGFQSLEGSFADQLAHLESSLRAAWTQAASRLPDGGVDADASDRASQRFDWTDAPFDYVAAEVLATAATLQNLARTGWSAATILVDEDVSSWLRAFAEQPKRPIPVLPIAQPDAGVTSRPVGSKGIPSVASKMLQTCGQGGTENNCPPDATWLPSASMGVGASAEFSSVVANRSGAATFTEGDFYTRLRWGTAAGPPGARINTAAFKSTTSPACDPDIAITSLSAPCDDDQSDVVFVPGATFESEGLVPNNLCLLPARTGTSVDQRAGCFLPTAGFSNLPNAFLDTTLADGRSPLNAAVGTVAPERLVEGATYETYVYFWAFGTEIVLFQEAVHNGQIGTDSFLCPLPSAFCTFAVDTSKLGDDIYLPLLPF